MKSTVLCSSRLFRLSQVTLISMLLINTLVHSADKLGRPESKLISGMPSGVTGLAFDGKVLWACAYTGGGGFLVKIDPEKLTAQQADFRIKGPGKYGAPGALAFDGKLLWLGESYGEGLWAINPANGQMITKIEKIREQTAKGSQSYAGLAYDGRKFWVAWHWMNYDEKVPAQLLLRFDPTRSEFDETAIRLPEGKRNDGAHALAWDGKSLWHAKNTVLSQISPEDSKVIASHQITEFERPSGMTYMNGALWIAEFSGKVWRLPIKQGARR